MKLSTKGRYAVMAMVDLAANASAKPVALADVADRQDISLSYLEQLFGKLRKAGLVKSVRGPGGGYLLAYGAADTRVADIIMAVDEPIKTTRCTPGQPTGCQADRARCLTHDLCLSSVSLEDVVDKKVLGTSGRLYQQEQDRNNAATVAAQ